MSEEASVQDPHRETVAKGEKFMQSKICSHQWVNY